MSYEKDHLRDTIRTAIGYELVPLSIRDHPEITKEFRTAEDADGLVDRIEMALRAEGYVRMTNLIESEKGDHGPTEELPTDGEVEEIFVRHLLGGRFSTKELAERFRAWLREHDKRVDREHIVELNSDHRESVRKWLERPNGTLCIGLPARVSFDSVEGGGVLVRTRPYR